VRDNASPFATGRADSLVADAAAAPGLLSMYQAARVLTRIPVTLPSGIELSLDRPTMRKFFADLAWETEAWCASDPTHLIHLNGERFLGPYA
jgi:hypothetical protein